ncbi:hypothetical protein GGTG_10335 [Gaeumannomyces tritici R3-111a-1]|uniref:Uncharacterized protein n=1 Tax=Gaeumannomyces tritici (strain R3-111a-1) TaxID=644352 RepID=J3PA11_GAET3|nr:hypothetical protein GGTG_10335 [Gaeumannomyces tritici R3-111a-1]EJT73497.1 hypothetical protein GGTG_10335 [Gaeumannomyces tritici R3-111a-1]
MACHACGSERSPASKAAMRKGPGQAQRYGIHLPKQTESHTPPHDRDRHEPQRNRDSTARRDYQLGPGRSCRNPHDLLRFEFPFVVSLVWFPRSAACNPISRGTCLLPHDMAFVTVQPSQTKMAVAASGGSCHKTLPGDATIAKHREPLPMH